jgi:hypothetical protein
VFKPFLLPRGVKNLAGRVFGHLTAVEIVEIVKGKGALWRCRCTCDETREVVAYKLIAGRVTRCVACANEQRAKSLQRAWQAAYDAGKFRPGRQTEIERGWREHLAALTESQRVDYDDMIARRRQMRVEITERVQAEAVDAAMRAA